MVLDGTTGLRCLSLPVNPWRSGTFSRNTFPAAARPPMANVSLAVIPHASQLSTPAKEVPTDWLPETPERLGLAACLSPS